MPRRVLAALLVLAAGPALAGTLSGRAHTSDGRPLPHLVLLLRGPSGERTVMTGLEGRFRAEALPEGEYTVTVQAAGLRGEERAQVGEAEASVDLPVTPAPVHEQVLVTAARAETPVSYLGVSGDALEAAQIEAAQPADLLHLLPRVPGVAVARAGGLGQQASAFVRGGNSNAVRLLVDGVPVNEPGGAFDLGGLLPLELERVEVVRGAASSLYGSDALAGAFGLSTRRAAPGEPKALLAEGEGGGLSWQRGLLGTRGRAGRLDWNAGLQRVTTDNDQPNSRFEETGAAASLGLDLGARTQARGVVRWAQSTTGTPGPVAFGRPDLDASFERHTLVAGLQVQQRLARGMHALSAGYAVNHQLSRDPLDSGAYVPSYQGHDLGYPLSDYPDPLGLQDDTERLSLGYRLEQQLGGRHLLTTGVDAERETGALGSLSQPPLLEPTRNNVGVYAQDQAALSSRAFLTLGARVEHNGSFGTRVVPRGALAVRLRQGQDATTLRASAGLGIKEPSFFESYGVSFYAQGNPDLKPERSRTADLGIEQRLLGGRLSLQLTAFDHQYRDQVAYHVVDPVSFQGTFVNLGHTSARGLEAAVQAAPSAHLDLRAAYTRLDGKVVVSTSDFDPVLAPGEPLLRRPQDQGTLEAEARAGRFSGGATLFLVGERADSDFLGLGLTRNPGYARLDARLRVQLGARVQAFAAGENLLDREYMEVLGYPALGRVLRAGLRVETAR